MHNPTHNPNNLSEDEIAELSKHIEEEWTKIKSFGLSCGYLSIKKDGNIRGKGDPNSLFDKYEESLK